MTLICSDDLAFLNKNNCKITILLNSLDGYQRSMITSVLRKHHGEVLQNEFCTHACVQAFTESGKTMQHIILHKSVAKVDIPGITL